jgi:hypothetical protein
MISHNPLAIIEDQSPIESTIQRVHQVAFYQNPPIARNNIAVKHNQNYNAILIAMYDKPLHNSNIFQPNFSVAIIPTNAIISTPDYKFPNVDSKFHPEESISVQFYEDLNKRIIIPSNSDDTLGHPHSKILLEIDTININSKLYNNDLSSSIPSSIDVGLIPINRLQNWGNILNKFGNNTQGNQQEFYIDDSIYPHNHECNNIRYFLLCDQQLDLFQNPSITSIELRNMINPELWLRSDGTLTRPTDYDYFINKDEQILLNAIYHIKKYYRINSTPITFNNIPINSTILEPFGNCNLIFNPSIAYNNEEQEIIMFSEESIEELPQKGPL